MGRQPLQMGAALAAAALLLAWPMTAVAQAAPVKAVAKVVAAGSCPPITATAIARGRTIFTGPGHCSLCHGADASGTAMAPTLHAHKWLNIDGSYPAIVGLVNLGVAKPKAHPEVMPPRGGADLSPGDVCAVSADVYSMSHSTAGAAIPASASAAPRPGARAPAAGAPAAGAPGRAAPQRLAAAPPVAAPAAAPAPASAPEVRTVSSGAMQITFKGTPDNYTIRVDNPDGRSSSTYSYSAQSAPPMAQESTATPSAAVPADPAGGTPAPAAGATPTQAPGCPPIAPALVAEGRKVFTGGGNCYACHGDNATGTPMAPTLHAHAWLDSDGSYASLVQLVTNGVATPKAHPAPMPPKGGGQVSGPQVCAVAAYVYSLSH